MVTSAGFDSLLEAAVDRDNKCAARDKSFIEMLRAYRPSGGLLRDCDALLLHRSRDHPSRPESGRAICFEWGGSLWMPRFQFAQADLSMRPGPSLVIGELHGVFDGWEMAVWFAQPNLWLGDQKPIDVLEARIEDVLGAARADRFIAAG